MITPDEMKTRIMDALECTYCLVETYEGQDHFRAIVVSPDFAGQSRVAQHKMVYAPLRAEMADAIHALELTTWTPLEWEDRQEDQPVTRAQALMFDEDKIEKKDKAQSQPEGQEEAND